MAISDGVEPMDSVHHLSGIESHCGDHAVLGIVTVSDRASSGTYRDEGGPAVLAFLKESLASPSTVH